MRRVGSTHRKQFSSRASQGARCGAEDRRFHFDFSVVVASGWNDDYPYPQVKVIEPPVRAPLALLPHAAQLVRAAQGITRRSAAKATAFRRAL